MIDWPTLLSVLRLDARELRYACRVGSQVYGTAQPGSDEDFVVVRLGDHPRDLIRQPEINVILQGETAFLASLAHQNLFALECLFVPPQHRLKDAHFPWKLDRRLLLAEISERSTSDFEKGIKTLAHEPLKARKRLFHALRVPTFAGQILREGRISDFSAANRYFEEIFTDPSEDPAHHDALWRPIWLGLLADLD